MNDYNPAIARPRWMVERVDQVPGQDREEVDVVNQEPVEELESQEPVPEEMAENQEIQEKPDSEHEFVEKVPDPEHKNIPQSLRLQFLGARKIRIEGIGAVHQVESKERPQMNVRRPQPTLDPVQQIRQLVHNEVRAAQPRTIQRAPVPVPAPQLEPPKKPFQNYQFKRHQKPVVVMHDVGNINTNLGPALGGKKRRRK